MNQCLSVHGNSIFTPEGNPIQLRGVGLGGWMNMENFITGYSGNEEAMRAVLLRAMGQNKYTFFFDLFLEYFFNVDDARFLKSLGLNLLRLPLNYRHFEDDMNPFIIKEEGFKHLDRVIQLCADHEIYTIIDLHSLPGYQNQDWHCDNPTHKAFFWTHKHFQDRAVNIWKALANRYKDNSWIAGYNLINEPFDPSEAIIELVYQRLAAAIREIDPYHILFLEGNRYSKDFHMFTEPISNAVYSNHLYAEPGFIDGGPYPGETNGRKYDKQILEEDYLVGSQYMVQNNIPVWVGEFGPVYTGDPQNDAMRYQLLQDQLEIFQKHQSNWAIWTYKDIGLQGIIYTHPKSSWNQHLHPYLEKKARLGVDAWGSFGDSMRHLLQPIEETLRREFPRYVPDPFGILWQTNRLVRHILFAEAMIPELGELFQSLSEDQIDNLLCSFAFENCVQRTKLTEILQQSVS